MRTGLAPGHNVDKLDIPAGLRELEVCGYSEPETKLVIEYALARWERGEEDAAERGAIDQSFHGISLTCWYRVLGASMAAAQMTNAPAHPLAEGQSGTATGSASG